MKKNTTKTKVKNRIHRGSYAFDVFLILLMAVICVIFLYPFLNVVSVSLSSNRMISTGQVTFFPREIILEGYKILFDEQNIWGAYLNTIIIAIGYTAVNLAGTSMVAYALSVPGFALKKFLTIFFLITMFFGGGTVPTYLLINDLHMMNTWWALILPNAIGAYNIFVYRSFYKGIAPEIREAARIDGASEFQTLTRIYVPLSKALYATFGLFAVVGIWNNYYDALLYISDTKLQPIQMVLRKIVFASSMTGVGTNAQIMIGNGELNKLNVQYACVVATMLPVMIIYPFVQKYFAQGMQLGAVKG
ncbi:MAG TPA: carbohydrate ABC transporter permease [Candidatus Mediterraneibacter cottocaccae]|nr:carbohydrate ABC transporter permease [Candidatus Mediterraneibacter cottocaccae]